MKQQQKRKHSNTSLFEKVAYISILNIFHVDNQNNVNYFILQSYIFLCVQNVHYLGMLCDAEHFGGIKNILFFPP